MRVRAVLLLLVGALAGGCADIKLQVGLHTRSAVYADSLLEQEKGVMAVLTANPPRVGTLQGVSPGAPLRGLGAFASDAVRVGLHRECPQATVLTGPATVGLAARAGKSRELAKLLEDANNSGILAAEDLAALGKATGLDYFFLGIVAAHGSANSVRLNPLGLTMIRSDWTTMNMVLQLWHAPSGRIVWQSVGDSTGYTESAVSNPVSVHTVTSDLAQAMLGDLIRGRSRSTVTRVGDGPVRAEAEPGDPGTHRWRERDDEDAYAPADKPEIEPEAGR
ncbi:MAG: hypothetical protein FJ260_00830 [Planctomycetes bacterium]|nr:hypothetical protein [Planctomycetota bacterium]